MIKKIIYALFILTTLIVLTACSGQGTTPASVIPDNQPAPPSVTVVVTGDFGKTLILEREVEIGGDTSAMAALQAVAVVETKYGGGFVSSINGIGSENEGNGQKDWFYYINGISSNVGARDYTLKDGDIEHWDFRDWSYHQLIPAIIGDFPQPFPGGFQDSAPPALVVYEEAFSGQASALVDKLKEYGIAEVSAIECDELSDSTKGNSNLVIMALAENPLISELNQAHDKLGFYAYFEDNQLIILDAGGEISQNPGNECGLIQATQNPWNSKGIGAGENVVWMITGISAAGVAGAAEALINGNLESGYMFAAVIENNTIAKIP